MLEQHILDSIRSQLPDMFPAERKAAEFILANPEKASQISVTELADLSDSSDATVIRMCKRLGFTGFYQLKLALASELGYIQLMGQQTKPGGYMDCGETLRLITRNIISMERNLDQEMLDEVVTRVLESRIVYVIAAGNSIPSAMDFSFRLNRIGIPAVCNVVIENTLNSLALAREDDLLFAVSHSGSSKQVIRSIELARSRGMHSVILTHSTKNSAALLADYRILSYPSTPLFQNYGIASHLFDNVVVDLLLYMIACRQNRRDIPDEVEMILSEFKV